MVPERTDVAAPELGSEAAFPELFSLADVCAVFRRKPRAMRDWDKRGWLKPVRIGGNVYYRREDVLRVAQIGTPRKSRKNKT